MPTPPQHPGIPAIPLQARRLAMVVGAIVAIVIALYFVFTNLRTDPDAVGKVNLTAWGVIDSVGFEIIADGYSGGGEIEYTQFEPDRYQDILLNALAAGEGPDIFMIHNRWLPREKDKLIPAPTERFSYTQMQGLFPRVIEQDFTDGGRTYALPVYLDTLAMFYNADYFDEAFIVTPPKTWTEFRNAVPKLRRLNSQGQIERAGAAIGGSKDNIRNAVDIVNLLMLQNDVPIVVPGAQTADFSESAGGTRGAVSAFNFYLQFANAGTPYYTWNPNQQNDFESFAGGKTAVIFGYAHQLPEIRAQVPFLNLRVAPIPQPGADDVPINYADYWGLAVSKQTRAPTAAWDFIVDTLANANVMTAYLEQGKLPPALLQIIGQIRNNPELEVFVRQALTARSWYQPDERKVQEFFSDAINRVIRGQVDAEQALNEVRGKLNEILRQ